LGTYFRLLGQHGLKMWLSNLLGLTTASVIIGMCYFIFLFLLGVVIGFSGAAFGGDVNPEDPAALLESMAGAGVAILILVLIGALFFILLSLLIYSFLIAGSYSMVNEIALDGISSVGTYFSSGFRYLGRMFLHLILLGLLLIPAAIPALVGEGLILWSYFQGNSSGTALWGIVAILGWIFVAIFSLGAMHGPVIMTAENKGAWESLKLSYKLTFQSFGHVLVTILTVVGAAVAYYLVFGLPMVLVMALGGEESIGAILLYLFFLMLFLLTLPFAQMAIQLIVSLRYKQKLRKTIVPEEKWPEQPSESVKGEETPDPTTHSLSSSEEPGESTDDSKPADASTKNAYPQFPTDPHLK
jgi:hypothetical protein